MFSDDEIKPTADGNFMRPGDEIISIREVCLSEKFDRKDFSLPGDAIGKSDLDAFFPEPVEQTRFAWTEEDGIAALVSGFGCSAPTSPGGLAAGRGGLKHADISPRSSSRKSLSDTDSISSSGSRRQARNPPNASKLDKSDPRTRLHYVKYLKRHGKTVKLWECGICSREFQHQYTLMRHLPTHTDERNFHCDVCTKSFRQLSTLSQHKAIHSADRPYSCEVCKKTFNRVSTLISHRKTHSNDKPYKCHLCPKGFHQKGNLRNHLFTHTNERPYRCHVCSAGFNQQSNLVCHKNKAHPEIVDNVDINSLNNNLLVHQKSTSETLKSSGQFNEVSSSSTDTFVEPKTDSVFWTMEPWSSMTTTGVLVEPIRTYHMGVAVAMNQTPFALLKPDEGPPVLVKVVDPKIPGGKQLLVPATSEDLRLGGKVVNSEEENNQIRVPVVAAVVSRRRPGGGVSLAVEEPHRAHRHDDTDDGSFSRAPHDPCASTANLRPPLPSCSLRDYSINNDSHTSCDVPLAPTPPLDLVSLDLFEHMESMCVGQYLYRSHV